MVEPRARPSPSEPRGGGAAETREPGPACYREGEYWTFVYADAVCRVRDVRGLRCLAFLLRHPGEEFAAVDLVGIAPDGGELAPKPWSEPPDPEDARVLVTKRIRGVIKKIQPHHPSLAHHLGTCIKTGTRCAYFPDPGRPVRWAT